MPYKAISIAPSGWLGNDGYWSTFYVQIGTPPTQVQVLPATSGSSLWVVLPYGCPECSGETCTCPEDRGNTFDPDDSSTKQWINGTLQNSGFQLPLTPETGLGYQSNESGAAVGFDALKIGFENPLFVPEQLFMAYYQDVPYVGMLGLSAANETLDFDGPGSWKQYTSLVGYLSSSYEPAISRYWGYTAGAYYRNDGIGYPASLTLGGYDAARGNVENVLTVTTQENSNADLIVDVTGVKITTSSGDLHQSHSQGISAFINSLVPEIWLPEEYWSVFEDALGLVWNTTLSMYIIDNEQNNYLMSLNPTVDLILGNNDGNSISISLAYEAFYQRAMYPLPGIEEDAPLHYFPLKRGSDETHYYLGRVFLQEAYVAVDYDQGEFYVSQAQFPFDTSESTIKTVHPRSKSIPAGAIAGIAVGCFALVAIVLGLFWWFKWRPAAKERKKRKNGQEMTPNRDFHGYYGQDQKMGDVSEQEAYEKRELDASQTARDSIASRSELPSPSLPKYSPGPRGSRASLGSPWSHHRQNSNDSAELAADYLTARRIPRWSGPYEMAADSEHEWRPSPVEIMGGTLRSVDELERDEPPQEMGEQTLPRGSAFQVEPPQDVGEQAAHRSMSPSNE